MFGCATPRAFAKSRWLMPFDVRTSRTARPTRSLNVSSIIVTMPRRYGVDMSRSRPDSRDLHAAEVHAQVGARVAELRKVRGVSQRALADALGISQPNVVFREQGKTPWSVFDIVVTAEALACAPADLLPTYPAPRPSLDLSPDELALIYAARRGAMLEASKALIRVVSSGSK